jgi:hypothetical protein
LEVEASMKHVIAVLVLALVTPGIRLQAQEAVPTGDVSGRDQLVRASGPFDEVRVRPDADLARFSEVHLVVDTLQFSTADARRDSLPSTTPGSTGYVVSPEEQQRFREVVTAAMIDGLRGSKKLAVVESPSAATLSVRASLLDIVVFVPPLSFGLVDVYLSEIGTATVRFELVDPKDGTILATLEERRAIRARGRMGNDVSPIAVNRLTMWGDIEVWSRRAASNLLRFIVSRQSP